MSQDPTRSSLDEVDRHGLLGRFGVDPVRCTGCQACVVACGNENAGAAGLPWRQVHTFNPFHHPALPVFHLSLACHHCEEPACLPNCPAGAYTRDEATGAVVHHPERCLGCRYCTWACPHDAPKFDSTSGIVGKCTLCRDRLPKGLEPACVAACPVEALRWEAKEDPTGAPEPAPSDLPGFPSSALRPSLRFGPPRPRGPVMAGSFPPQDLERLLPQVLRRSPRKITLAGEWSLLVFTTGITVLVAWHAASPFGGPPVHPWVFLAMGGAAMTLSAWHLGRKARAWRALRNLRTSWLSREILLVSAFLGLSLAAHLGPLFLGNPGIAAHLASGLAIPVGFGALFAVDRLYALALRTGVLGLHSAHTLLNALFLAGLLAQAWPLALAAGLGKAALYLHRKLRLARQGLNPHLTLSILRGGLGFLAPALLLPGTPLLAALGAVLGDLVDRAEFYDELRVETPAALLDQEIRQRLSGPDSTPSAGPPR